MPTTLLLLGLLSVGSLAFFGRLAVLDSRRSLVSVEKYQVVDLFMIAILALYYLPIVFLSLTGSLQNGAITREALAQGIVRTLALLTLVLGVVGCRFLNPLELFGLRGKSPRTIFLAAGACLIAVLPLIFFTQALTQSLIGETPEQPLMTFLRSHQDWVDRSLLIFTAVILAPVTEEIIFRGYVYGVIRRYGGRWCGLLFSAAFFAVIHGHAPSLVPLFLLAVCLTLAYEYTGSLWTNMLIHAAFNSLSILAAICWPKLG